MKRLFALATLSLAVLSQPVLAQSAPDRLAQFRHRVERLEDHDRIELLQATYGYYFDKGLWSEVAALFSRDARFEYGQSGVYIGRERIGRALLLFGPERLAPGYLNNHMQLQAVITVADDGRTATARWQGMVMLSQPGANGQWGVGIYENAYVKEGGVWKISSLHFYLTGMTDYDLGWTRSAVQMQELADAVIAAAPDARIELRPGENPNGNPADNYLDLTRIKDEFGFEPRYPVLERGIPDYIDWLRTHDY